MELIDVVNENNEFTGKVEEKDIIHTKGMWHREVAIWIMNKNGEILLQKRSANKEINPDKWGLTAGHIDAGEKTEDAMSREIFEELGVNINNLKMLFIQKNHEITSKGKINNNFTYHFFAKVDYKINDYTIQEDELSELKYITLKELENIVEKKDDNYTFSKRDYMSEIINYLYKEMNR